MRWLYIRRRADRKKDVMVYVETQDYFAADDFGHGRPMRYGVRVEGLSLTVCRTEPGQSPWEQTWNLARPNPGTGGWPQIPASDAVAALRGGPLYEVAGLRIGSGYAELHIFVEWQAGVFILDPAQAEQVAAAIAATLEPQK